MGSSFESFTSSSKAIVGNTKAIETLRNLITKPPTHANKLPRGLLLYGPPGTGKTTLVRAVVDECGSNLIMISYTGGDSEKTLSDAFSEASDKPSVIFIDELDRLFAPPGSKGEKDDRIASHLCTLMDSSKATSSRPGAVVVATTNRLDAIHPALRTSGRFDIETWVTVPNQKERFEILETKLKEACEWFTKHPDAFSRSGTTTIRGILLHGPVGCGKTTLAKAVDVPFISLSGVGIHSKFAIKGEGEVEGYLREIFNTARLARRSIIFFNEVDFIAGIWGGSKKILSALLTEMDGLAEAKGVLVLAATNRIELIDDALKCPGRFDLILEVPPPDLEGRCEILDVLTRKMELGSDVDLRRLAEDTELFPGLDLRGLCHQAGMGALSESIDASVVADRHFHAAKNYLKEFVNKLH